MIRLLNIAIIFSQPAILNFFSGRWKARGGTFFSIRVDSEFPTSGAGRAIMKTFRFRVWMWTSLIAVTFAFTPAGTFLSPLWFVVALMTTLLGNGCIFSRASRQVRAVATATAPPALRTASLEVAETRATLGLALIEWAGILLPVALPVVTAIVLISAGKSSLMASFYVVIGFLPVQMQYALRFGARAGDWASDPALSRRYRAYLGLINTLVFGSIILQGCALALIPHSAIFTYFWFVFPGYAILFPVLFRVRAWLKRNLAESSCDPMADACWKWGQYYFNPDDPALIVPSRTGITFSPNFARRSIWISWVAVSLVAILGLVYSSRLLVRSLHANPFPIADKPHQPALIGPIHRNMP